MHIALTLPGREIGFDIDYDPTFQADVATKLFLERNSACEPEVVHLMNRVLREGDVAFDVGANIGFFTLLMSKLVGPAGKVLAFEPDARNLTKLRVNLALNRLGNVLIHERALWSEPGKQTLHLPQDSGLSALACIPGAYGSVEVEVDTLDAFSRLHPRLIKIDVEGAEEIVLRGAPLSLLSGIDYIVCELSDKTLARFDCTQDSLRQFMYEQGYQMFILHADDSLPSLVPPSTRVVSQHMNTNVLFSSVVDVGLAWPEAQIA